MVKTKEFTKFKKREKKNSHKNVRKIPKDKFEAALKLIKKPNAEIWSDENTSCLINIHNVNKIDGYSSLCTFLRHARIFLLRRDIASLANIIRLVNIRTCKQAILIPVFVKYAALCLANGNHKSLESFCKTLFLKDIEHMMRMCTTYEEPIPGDQQTLDTAT